MPPGKKKEFGHTFHTKSDVARLSGAEPVDEVVAAVSGSDAVREETAVRLLPLCGPARACA